MGNSQGENAMCVRLFQMLIIIITLSSRAYAMELHVDGPHFKNQNDATVILRGWNISAKVPPYKALRSAEELETLRKWGANVIRLTFNWEAFEPQIDHYNDDYLDEIAQIVEWAWQKDIYTIIDIHQDAYSRYSLNGCGEGFPRFAVVGPTQEPDNGISCQGWGEMMFDDFENDGPLQGQWQHFYNNTRAVENDDSSGIRDQFLELLEILALKFAGHDSVIGFDILNEPFGDYDQINELYRQAAERIRRHKPHAIVFASPHALTSGSLIKIGFGSKPQLENFAFSPHYYDPIMMVFNKYNGAATDIGENPSAGVLGMAVTYACYWQYPDLRTAVKKLSASFGSAVDVLEPQDAVTKLKNQALSWNVPLFIGEFGAPATANGLEYFLDGLYSQMNTDLVSGAQWIYSPSWDPETKDGWNNEDLSVVDHNLVPRRGYRPMAFPRQIAGDVIASQFQPAKPHESIDKTKIFLSWEHDPAKGATIIFVPKLTDSLSLQEQIEIQLDGSQTDYSLDGNGLLTITSGSAGIKSITVRYLKEQDDSCLLLFKHDDGFNCSDGIQLYFKGKDPHDRPREYSQRGNYQEKIYNFGSWKLYSEFTIEVERTILWNTNWTKSQTEKFTIMPNMCNKVILIDARANCFGADFSLNLPD